MLIDSLLGSIEPLGFVGMPGRSLDIDNNRVVDHPVDNQTKSLTIDIVTSHFRTA